MSFRRLFQRCVVGIVLFGVGWLIAAPRSMGAGQEAKPPGQPPAASATDEKPRQEAKKVVKTDAEWRKQLTKTQYRVTREKWTEPAFSGAYWKSHKDGVFQCVCCGQLLFDSKTKFESGTGWPSFWAPLEKGAVSYRPDLSEAEARTEVLCSRCDAHLGHVFGDGPPPTGSRFCMNSAALKLVDRDKAKPPVKTEEPAGTKAK